MNRRGFIASLVASMFAPRALALPPAAPPLVVSGLKAWLPSKGSNWVINVNRVVAAPLTMSVDVRDERGWIPLGSGESISIDRRSFSG